MDGIERIIALKENYPELKFIEGKNIRMDERE